ncbi:Ig-like domain-containing protein [Corallincola platygyrae]|uniref:Ig-like domain-containing protein n=1 Tax=Corallincola platygyrae TaxID=1193278 RepID=A0ABW4XJR1_9GAMM
MITTARKSWWILLGSLFLVACGGGDGLSQETEPDPEPEPQPTITYTLTTNMVDSAGESIRSVSAAQPGFLKATLLREGAAASNELISFVTTAGSINPSLGTALTDENGVATVNLLPGTEAGAGIATATFALPSDEVSEAEEDSVFSDFSFNTAGDGESDTGDNSFLLSLDLSSVNISAAEPGVVTVNVLNASGQPVQQRVVTFTSTLGTLTPASGTALTDSSGTAVIQLNAGSVQGAGELTVSFEGSSTSIGFFTEGDVVDDNNLTVDIVTTLYNCPEGDVPPSNTCVESNNISNAQPGSLLVTVTQEGSSTPIADALVNVVTTIGRLSPSNGSVITNSAGQAVVDILADTEVGAGEYTVTVQGEQVTRAFQVGAADIVLAATPRTASLPAGSSTVIDIEVFEADGVTPYTETLTLELSSACQIAGTSEIDSPVVTINGLANSTYTAAGCVGTDRVEVSALTGGRTVSQTIDLVVAPASVGAIQFIGVSEEFIAIQQAGGLERPTTSIVTFRLLDANDNPVANRELEFSLSSGNGDVSIAPLAAFTDSNGYARTTVTSGTVPTPVRVATTYSEGGEVVASNVSDKIIVSTGLADNNSFTLAVSDHNPEGLQLSGTEVVVTAYAADHFNNPVPDGTTVFFTSEGGAVEPSCQTENGTCSVTWRSQNPRPLASGDPRYSVGFDFENTLVDAGCTNAWGAPGPCLNNEILTVGTATTGPQGARSGIMAFILGEESFLDANNNGQFDDGEYFVPLGDAFVDHNENLGSTATVADAYDEDTSAAQAATSGTDLNGGELEEFFDNPIPEAADGVYTPPADPATARYQGTLCSDAARAAGHCAVPAVHARAHNTIVMAGSTAYFRVLESDTLTDIAYLDLFNNPTDSVEVVISDILNNPMPSGSSVNITVSGATLLSSGSSTYPDTTGVTSFGISVKRPDDPDGDGLAVVTITTPSGVVSSREIEIFLVTDPTL